MKINRLYAWACLLFLVSSSAHAGDMKVEVVADDKLFRSHFGITPFPNDVITIYPEGAHFLCSSTTRRSEYNALYSFFKLGGDLEISVNYDWVPVGIPKGDHGVRCGVSIETNDKKHSVTIVRGNFRDVGSCYRVSIGTKNAKRNVDHTDVNTTATKATKGKLILTRKKNEVICLVEEKSDEPIELCRVPFTDAAVQRVLIFADPGSVGTELDAWLTQIKMQADEMSHHMTQKEIPKDWWGVIIGVTLFIVGTISFVVIRRMRTGRWDGKENTETVSRRRK